MNIDTIFTWFRNNYGWQEHIPVDLQLGHDKLLLITGENASGKSLLRRLLQSLAKKHSCEAIAISPEYKQFASGIARVFVYGDESYDASGQIACKTVIQAMRTSQQRAQPHIIILDEPDMGMSDNTVAGAAVALGQFCEDPNPHLGCLAIITHRKAMLEQFLTFRPSHIRVGDTMTLREVVAAPIRPIAPGEVIAKSRELCQKMAKILK